jgi:hypothetical protein
MRPSRGNWSPDASIAHIIGRCISGVCKEAAKSVQVLPRLLAVTEEVASTAEEMSDTAVVCKCNGNIPGGCKTIRMDTLAPNDSVKRLKSLRCEKNCRAKASNICREVENKVKFGFIEPAWCPANYAIQKVCDCSLETGLNIGICKTQLAPNNSGELTIYPLISAIVGCQRRGTKLHSETHASKHTAGTKSYNT